MNSPESRTPELKVGFFVLVGLLIGGALIIQFGRLGQGLRPRYQLTVEFPNASGLLPNSKVLLAGAQVGNVTSSPRVLPGARGVNIDVKIYANVQIPRNAVFVVGSSGLLGDRFVDVIPAAEDAREVFQPGDAVKGQRQAGMEDLQREGGLLLTDMRKAIANMDQTITGVREDLLKKSTFEKLEASLQNLEGATKGLRESSDKIGGLVTDARSAVGDARTALQGGRDTLETAKKAAEDLRGAIADTRKVLASTRRAVDQATTGRGPIAALLTDKALSDNLSALISNLRTRGILFYKDRPVEKPPAPPEGEGARPAPRR